MELNMIVLFVFTLQPAPTYDLYAIFRNWSAKMFNYIVLKPQDIIAKSVATPGVISVMYLVLFFAFMQAKVFSERRHLYSSTKHKPNEEKEKRSSNPPDSEKSDEDREREMDPPQLIRHYQKKQGSLHVRLPVYSTKRDFTVKSNPRNYYDEFRLLFFYRIFNKIPLILFFIDAAITPGFIKVVQMALCLIYFNQINRIYWKTRYFWVGIGAFYYIILFILALYQIPLAVVGDPGTNWGGQLWTAAVMRFFGLTSMADAGKIVLAVLVLSSYYIQDRIFLTEDYVFFVNLLWKERERRKLQQARNRAFLAAQLVKRFAERSYLKKRREMAMHALKNYQQVHSDVSDRQDLLKNLYSDICASYKKNISEAQQERLVLEQALRKVVRSRQIQSAIVDSMDLQVMSELLEEAEKIVSVSVHSEPTTEIEHDSHDQELAIETQQEDPKDENDEDPFQAMAQTPRQHSAIEDDKHEIPHLQSAQSVTFGGTTTYEPDVPQDSEQQEQEGSSPSTESDSYEVQQEDEQNDEQEDNDAGSDSDKQEEESQQQSEEQEEKTEKTEDQEQQPASKPKKEKSKLDQTRALLLKIERIIYKYAIMAIDLLLSIIRPMMSIALENRDDIVRILTDVAIKDDKAQIFGDGKDYAMLKMKRPQLRKRLWKRCRDLYTSLFNCLQSNTDTICYLAFVINLVYSPTIYNIAFTVVAFVYAAQQSPYPSRQYWELSLFFTMLMMVFKYLIYLIQEAIYGSVTSNDYDKKQLIGWNPSTTLLSDIIMYLVIMLTIYFHRDTLKKRGEWNLYNRRATDKKDDEMQSPRADRAPQMEFETSRNMISPLDNITSKSFRRRAIRYEHAVVVEKNEGDVHIAIEKSTEIKEKTSGASAVTRFISDSRAYVVQYYENLTKQERKLGGDFYVISNLTHIVALIFFAISFNYMNGRPTDNITGDIASNQLSGTYVIILFLFFIEICVERVLYLKSALKLKVLFLLAQVVTYHIIYFVFYDIIQMNQNPTGATLLGVLFAIKCFSMWLSCLQIKNGYPSVGTLSQFFAKSYFWIFSYVYSLWRAIPFVFELKTILDWTFIPTSLSFNDWLKMEDIYRALYLRKCDIESQNLLGRKFGHPHNLFTKGSNGFLVFSILCILIFFPLIFYSTANPTLSYNSINYISTSVGIRGFETMYTSSNDLTDSTGPVIYASSLVGSADLLRTKFPDFIDDQIQTFENDDFSDALWSISVPSMKMLSYQLGYTNKTLTLVFTTTIDRLGPSDATVVSIKQNYQFTRPQRDVLANMINHPYEASDLPLGNVYNPYLLNKYDDLYTANVDNKFLPNCTMGIRSDQNQSLFWVIYCTPYQFFDIGNQTANSTGIFFWIQSTRIVSDTNSLTSIISGIGIVAFYTTFVLAVGNVVRGFASGLVQVIFYENVDNVDLLLSFVMDIYMARECKDVALEEMMFTQLLRIFRDTPVLQIWTVEEEGENAENMV
jgi:hypothetical protein